MQFHSGNQWRVVAGGNESLEVRSGVVNVDSLEIQGTDVISSSRQLQNIASLDSTTAATIGAAAGGGHGAVFEELFTETETNWQPKIAGDVYVIVVGAGGTGGITKYYSYATFLYNRLTIGGGGSGGVIVHKFSNVSTSQAASTITVGAAGTLSFYSNGAALAGIAGGSSSITIGGTTLTAGGGGGGTQSGGTAYGLDRTAVGGAGGSASGGNIANFAGTAGGTGNNGASIEPSVVGNPIGSVYAGNTYGGGTGGRRYISEHTLSTSVSAGGGVVRIMYAG
jgi:hypothetical protein